MTNDGMFSDMPDPFLPQRHNSELREFGDLARTNVCVHCKQEYYTSWHDHAEKCSMLGVKRLQQSKEIPLFQTQQVKTDKEEIAELRREVESLKKKLETK